MTETVQIALITGAVGIGSAVVAPIILAWITGNQRKEEKKQDALLRAAEKKQDRDREDEVAARTAKVLIDSNATVAAKLVESNEQTAKLVAAKERSA